MLFMIRYWLILGTIFFAACGDNTHEVVTPEQEESQPMKDAQLLLTSVDHLRLRDQPNGEGEVLGSLRENVEVMWHREVSDKVETVSLRGKEHTGPWYKVTTVKGTEGWIFSGGLKPWEPGLNVPYRECMLLFNDASFSHFYPCLEGVSRVESQPDQVLASGQKLSIKMDNGQRVSWTHNLSPGSDYQLYQYIGHLKEEGCHVVKVNRQGGSKFLLINAAAGQEYPVAGLPQPLSFGRGLLCLGPDPLVPGSIFWEVWDTKGTRIQKYGEGRLDGYSLSKIQWRQDGLPDIYFRDNSGSEGQWNLQKNGSGKWELREKN